MGEKESLVKASLECISYCLKKMEPKNSSTYFFLRNRCTAINKTEKAVYRPKPGIPFFSVAVGAGVVSSAIG
ncbi:MAG: hypothetical protein M8349_08640, partial [ANME-2 cluster archaeon]|nr:hypothetical protein [ANME-2 cluster archaeon]